MVASTNLVIELGVLLFLLLGWHFVVAQFVGGAIMVAVLALTTSAVFSVARQGQLRERVLRDAPPLTRQAIGPRRRRLPERDRLVVAARYTTGDLTMLRRELAAGFLVAGFLAVHVPTSWWRDVFVSGHGSWTVLENVLLAPLVGVLAFVCSVGNIPLAATLWARGVAFGGVIAFIFADLVTLPLLAIYRRFYGAATAGRLLALLWFTMSLGGLVVEVLFRSAGLAPTSHHVRALSGDFPLGATLVLNIVATIVLVTVWWLARRTHPDATTATDPVCGMTVEVASPSATREEDGVTVYFCSPRCAERFGQEASGQVGGDLAVDPVCGMEVATGGGLSALGIDGVTYYFCNHGCQRTFLEGSLARRAHESSERQRGPMSKQHTSVRAYGILVHDGRVLLVRSSSPQISPPLWWLPGGGIDFGESPEETLLREFTEETGLSVKDPGSSTSRATSVVVPTGTGSTRSACSSPCELNGGVLRDEAHRHY